MTRVFALVVVVACAPASEPLGPAPATDPIVGHWTIVDHMMSPDAEISDSDALAMHGRVVEITAGGYTTPWHGTCGEAGRQLTPQILADVDVMHNFGDAQPRFKLPPNVVEYVFTCVDNKRSPQATIYLGNDQAMTCWAGACYLLARRR